MLYKRKAIIKKLGITLQRIQSKQNGTYCSGCKYLENAAICCWDTCRRLSGVDRLYSDDILYNLRFYAPKEKTN